MKMFIFILYMHGNDMDFIKTVHGKWNYNEMVPTCGIVTLKSTAEVCNGYLWHNRPLMETIDSVWDDARPLMSTPSAWAMVQPERQRCSGMKTTSIF